MNLLTQIHYLEHTTSGHSPGSYSSNIAALIRIHKGYSFSLPEDNSTHKVNKATSAAYFLFVGLLDASYNLYSTRLTALYTLRLLGMNFIAIRRKFQQDVAHM